ncbi:MAG TPA: rhodanese-like domain-containing protein [Lachnospiraceae bacterium]
MSLFGLFQSSNIHVGLEEFEKTENALLLDVRTPQEYRQGHIPKSKNLPLVGISNMGQISKDKNQPIFVYCLSGGRSSQAVTLLKKMGYQKVKNIGGINSYKGPVSK